MIGKVVTGCSFSGCISYCLDDKKVEKKSSDRPMKDRAKIFTSNLCVGSKKELIRQFNEVRKLNPKQTKPVMHLTISFPPDEKITKAVLIQITAHCSREFGFENNQFIAVEHFDTKHQHFHIVVNRIGYDGRTVSDSNNFKKVSEFCRRMEKTFNLKEVLSPKKFLQTGEREAPRLDRRKDALKVFIGDALVKAKSYQEFAQAMSQGGYEIEKGRGISFLDKQFVKFKGSELGFSLASINSKIQTNQNNNLSPTKFINMSQHQKSLSL